MIISAMMFTSCGKTDYKSFVGTWGVEKLVYESYNTDYAGNPIAGSMETETFNYDPNDVGHGLQLIFRSDRTGEMRDNDIDSLPKIVKIEVNGVEVDTTIYIQCPDTTLVSAFTYSYDKDEAILYLNLKNQVHTYMMNIIELSNDAFVYENNYGMDEDNRLYFERAYMKRLSNTPSKSATRQKATHPHKPGSFLGDR